MTKIIMLDGGIGRVITAIPALLKYHKNHSDEEWYVMIPGWDFITWGIPELQERTFNPDARGSFDLYWKADKIISPEPYRVPAYYRNEISLREAFDVEINNSTNHEDLPPMQLKLSCMEERVSKKVLLDVKQKNNKKQKTIVIQPYGSSTIIDEFGIFDPSLRSIPANMLAYFIKNLSKSYNLIFMGPEELYNLHLKSGISREELYRPDPDPSLREWAAIIKQSDYFIGCDSCGQHMCNAVNKKASVVIISTHKKNVTYENFHIIERDVPFYPDAMRISGFQSHMASRLNESRIQFTQEEIEKSYNDIIKNIEGSYNNLPSFKTLKANQKNEEKNSVEIKKVSYS